MPARLLIAALLLPSACPQPLEDRTLQDKLAAMGIEWIKTADNSVPFTHSWRDTTALAILKDVVKAQSGYELEVSGDVVHVFPTAMKGDPADMLNKRHLQSTTGGSRPLLMAVSTPGYTTS